MFNQEARKYLLRCKRSLKNVPQDVLDKRWEGRDAESWFESVKNSDDCPNNIRNSSDWDISGLSTKQLNRGELIEELSELRSSRPISDKAIKKSVIEIFAWGRMRKNHARMVLPGIKKYQEICKDLVRAYLNPVDTYKEFFIAYHSKEFKGMGPAYYTKLIYFLGDQKGPILDQWTGRSINKLCKYPIVMLGNGENTVSMNNGPKRYAKYIEIVEQLQKILKLQSPSEAEELMFSCSHNDPRVEGRLGEKHHKICSAWRRYVDTGEMIEEVLEFTEDKD